MSLCYISFCWNTNPVSVQLRFLTVFFFFFFPVLQILVQKLRSELELYEVLKTMWFCLHQFLPSILLSSFHMHAWFSYRSLIFLWCVWDLGCLMQNKVKDPQFYPQSYQPPYQSNQSHNPPQSLMFRQVLFVKFSSLSHCVQIIPANELWVGFLSDDLFLLQISCLNIFFTRLIDLGSHGSYVDVHCLSEIFTSNIRLLFFSLWKCSIVPYLERDDIMVKN